MKSPGARTAAARVFSISAGVLLSVLALYLAVREVDYTEVWGALGEVRLGWIGLALLSVGVNVLGRTLRWRVLLGAPGRLVARRKLLASLLFGNFLNILLPARAGDLGRAYLVGGLGPGRVFTFSSVAVEKVADLVAYAALLGVLIFTLPLPGWVRSPAYALAALALAFGAGLALLSVQRTWLERAVERLARWLPEMLQARAVPALRAALASIAVLRDPGVLFRVSFWTALIWVTGVLTNHLTQLAFHFQAPLAASLLLTVALQVGITLPAAPGSVGIFEYICVLALGVFGISQSAAFGYGVVLHAVILLPTILAGLLSFWIMGSFKRQPGFSPSTK